MAGKIVIDTERCKGCGLCVTICPRKSLKISSESNKNGYFPAQTTDSDCTGCAQCALICPEGIIEVCREQMERIRIAAVPGKPDAPRLIEEKA